MEAQIGMDSPAVNREVRELAMPGETTIAVLIRDDQPILVRPETRLRGGDKLLAITSAEHEAELRSLGAVMLPVAAVLMGVALAFFPSDVRPLVPALRRAAASSGFAR